ncbi:M28 family metallopeptidase [Brassicibacter mesophilus]|uniref:M28 family metallopeptidase n=1 Tax=Brassicibacter mesophilus TaxID=745119 RepID=UPI003D2300B1
MNKRNLKLLRKLSYILVICILMVGCVGGSYTGNFETIEHTINGLEDLDYRVTNSSANYQLANELKTYLKTLENEKAKVHTHEYNINIPKKYELMLTYKNDSISLNTTNSMIISVNEKEIATKKAVLINSLEEIKNDEKYMFIAYNWDDVNRAKLSPNISVILLVEDSDNSKSIIKVDNNSPTFIIIDSILSERLSDFINHKLSVEVELSFENILLENIYMTYKGNNSKNAIVLTAHYDAIGSTNGVFSKGIIDNGSGVALILDILRKNIKNNHNTNMDIIFSFVNSEEQMYSGLSGSRFFKQYLNGNYDYILNINLDSLGEKDVETVYYGTSGNINNDLVGKYVQNSLGNDFSIKKVNNYTSDNINFENSIFFYNFNYNNDKVIIHTEKDNKNSIDIDKLQTISEMLWKFLLNMSKSEIEDIKQEKVERLSCSIKAETYYNDLSFGQYVFYDCDIEPNKVHFFVKDTYQQKIRDLTSISENFCKGLTNKNSIYDISVNFDLPEIQYENQQLGEIGHYFDKVPDLQSLIDQYPISTFTLINFEADSYEVRHVFSVQKYPIEQSVIIEHLQQDFPQGMKDLLIVKKNEMDIYMGYEHNGKIIKSILKDDKYFYVYNFIIYSGDLLSMTSDDLTNFFVHNAKDVLNVFELISTNA